MATVVWVVAPVLTGAFIAEAGLRKRVSVEGTVSVIAFIVALMMYSQVRNVSQHVATLTRMQKQLKG